MFHRRRAQMTGVRYSQRGAGLVEYALGMAFIGMAAVVGFQQVTSATGSQMQRKASVGAPDLGSGTPVIVSTTVPGTTTPEGPTTTVPPTYAARVTTTGAGVRDKGNDWIATATVTVRNVATNAIVPQAVVTGRWSSDNRDTSCITQADGTCPLTLSGIDRRDQTVVTLTIVSAANSSFSSVELPAPMAVNYQ